MNLILMSHQLIGHAETGPRLKVLSERPEKQEIEPVIFGLIDILHVAR